MSTNIRFMVYNAYGIGGTVKTIFNFANYFFETGKYHVEIISIKRSKDVPTLYINPKIKITVIQDSRRNAEFSAEDAALLDMPSELIHPEEDLYAMFNGLTDRRLKEILSGMHDGVLVTTMPSFNTLSANYVDEQVLKIGQEHKSYADHTPGIQKMIRDSYAKLDAITILTERNKAVYERKIHGEVPVYVLGNGTEYLKFRADLKNHIIVAAGRYAEQKGYDMLIKAFGIIKDRFPDWIVKIYGEGQLTEEYVELIQKYHVENQIILEPGSDKMDEKLSETAIHVCSSYYEPFGMVIIEGFAMGIPCVSFACDGPSEIITDGYDGVLVPREDTDALAAAMARLMSDENLRFEMGKNARETAKKYDIREIGKKLEQIVSKEMQAKKNKEKIESKAGMGLAEKTFSQQQKAELNVRYEEYETMVNIASQGKIGLKTIWSMFRGWFEYKMRKVR